MIIGISAYYHDSAVCISQDGDIIFAAQEERFTRIKHDASFPSRALKAAIDFSGLSLKNLEGIIFYEKPLLKIERVIENFYANVPSGIWAFAKFITQSVKNRVTLRKRICREFKAAGLNIRKKPLWFSEHHLSHAASAYYASPFDEAVILTMDGVGEWTTTSIMMAKGDKITKIREIHYPDSLGLLYSAATQFLGFRVNSGEYKVMGLAPYGERGSDQVIKLVNIIKDQLITLFQDGSFQLKMEKFRFQRGQKMLDSKQWEELFGISSRKPEQDILQEHSNFALAVQLVLEEAVINLAGLASKLTGSGNLCLAGGVALNCVANTRIEETGLFKRIFVQPAAGDAGGALGASLCAEYLILQKPRQMKKPDLMKWSRLGPEYSDAEIKSTLKRLDAVYHDDHSPQNQPEIIAGLLASGKTLGWFQGQMEFGPRALGSRSILADARNQNMRLHLNQKVKFREDFRPFAPVMLEDEVVRLYRKGCPSHYMLFIDYYKGHVPLPAVTHLDQSARLQTVSKESDPYLFELLKAFQKISGIGLLINTSFNVRGEPLVCSPENAFVCFMRSGLDVLVIGNNILYKHEQVPLPGKLLKSFKPD